MKFIIVILIIIIILMSFYIYYQASKKICAEEPIINDVLWILKDKNLNLEKINCKNGQSGIKIK